MEKYGIISQNTLNKGGFMEQYSIKIVRPSASGPLRVYKVELDGFQVGKLGSRSELSIPTSAGNHTLSFIWMGKAEKTIQINIPEGQHMTLINSKLNNWSGKIELEMGNLSQATTTSTAKSFDKNNNSAVVNQTNLKKKKLHPALIVLIVIIFIGFIASLGDDSTETVDNNSTNVQNVEMTDEEKAQTEIEKATTKFSEGKYREALEICNKVTETYPNTETTSNMNNYIKEQYAQFPQYTAKQLMAEYEANIVNADKEYTDKVMIVSGTVSRIDKTNNDKNLCVLLKSGTYFYAVQLNFDTSQTDAVSALKEGDSVKAIGKCTGKSGKHFLVFDGENVMISNCLLID